jgi:methylenetetrahydrofolate reductase (NADPH)
MLDSFSDRLKRGDFFVLFELPLPREESEASLYESSLKKIEAALTARTGINAAFAFTDFSDIRSFDQTEFLSAVSPEAKSSSVVFLSGRGASPPLIDKRIGDMRRIGVKNIVAATGSAVSAKTGGEKSPYYDSVHTINRLVSSDNDGFFSCGAVINPFKYTPEEVYPQYYKLMKKLRMGASFAITQAGWDMQKLQELRWFLEMRDTHIPTIARIMMLTPDIAEEIFAGNHPGIVCSDDIRNIFRKEARFGYAQFASAQWRRLQIMTAGARLLGYSAVQIAGIERSEHIGTALTKMEEALKEFTTFEDWKAEYSNHLARAETAPFPHRYYVFEDLFKRQYPEGQLKLREVNKTKISAIEKIKYKICSKIFNKAHRQVPEEHYFSKKLLVDCKGCKYCRLPLTQFVCPETCPKGLANGPCGGTFPGGECEFRGRKCIHTKIFKYAAWQKETNLLEEKYIKPVE